MTEALTRLKRTSNHVYPRLPIALQNAALSRVGWHNDITARGRGFARLLDEYEINTFADRDEKHSQLRRGASSKETALSPGSRFATRFDRVLSDRNGDGSRYEVRGVTTSSEIYYCKRRSVINTATRRRGTVRNRIHSPVPIRSIGSSVLICRIRRCRLFTTNVTIT